MGSLIFLFLQILFRCCIRDPCFSEKLMSAFLWVMLYLSDVAMRPSSQEVYSAFICSMLEFNVPRNENTILLLYYYRIFSGIANF